MKLINGPYAQTEGYPRDVIHFAQGRESSLRRFLACEGFLVYNIRKNGGAKTKYGYGTVSPNQERPIPPRIAHGRTYNLGAWVATTHVVHPRDGVPIAVVREVLGIRNIQSIGGLLKISQEGYEELLSLLLEKQFNINI